MMLQAAKFHPLLFFCLIALTTCAQKKSIEKLGIGNDLYSKTFQYQITGPGPIQIEYIDKISQQVLTDKTVPYFELVISGQVTSAMDKLWVFQSHKKRDMENGGTEHLLTFVGSGSHVDGLEITIVQQVFPNSTLIREQLKLGTGQDQSYALNKLNNRLHFKFPQYGIICSEDIPKSTEIRIASWELQPITFTSSNPKRNQNHMYYPNIISQKVTDELAVKGPLNVLSVENLNWISAYEHASQDDLNGMLNESKVSEDGKIVDAMQGTKGIFNFKISDDDFRFIEISQKKEHENVIISNDIVRGGYFDGEVIDKNKPYATVWNATAFHAENDFEESKAIIRNYLINEICEKPASRKPEFYYNTWGMQRTDRNKPLRGILTYERIFEEIDRAAELGIDIFVLDDGWEQAQGDWTPHKDRLAEGLAPIKKKLDEYGIKMGVWLSPMGIDSSTARYQQHQDWVIKDSEGNPILAQWGHPAFDFVGPFFDVFIEDCKRLIDDGARFFKWDAINTFYSSLPNLHHGTTADSEVERRARYEYLLPIYVTRAMEILTAYEPELIIEMDVTEARRVMIGLAPLSQGKLFHMNNGASWYNDYTEFRTNSMRTIPNVYNGIIPLELFTYANYPHNLEKSMDYNVNTSLIAGHGFWGDLSLTKSQERRSVGDKVAKSKLVLPYLTEVETEIIGNVGDSPEIYTQVNREIGAGQIIAFSSNKTEHIVHANISKSKPLAVLNHPYRFIDNSLELVFQFQVEPSTREAFLIPKQNVDICISSSTCIIDDVQWKNNQLEYATVGNGTQEVYWSKEHGKPAVLDPSGLKLTIEEKEDHFLISLVSQSSRKIKIAGNTN